MLLKILLAEANITSRSNKVEVNIPGDPKRTWARLSRVLQHVHGHRVLPYYQLGRGRQCFFLFLKKTTLYSHIDIIGIKHFLINFKYIIGR